MLLPCASTQAAPDIVWMVHLGHQWRTLLLPGQNPMATETLLHHDLRSPCPARKLSLLSTHKQALAAAPCKHITAHRLIGFAFLCCAQTPQDTDCPIVQTLRHPFLAQPNAVTFE